MLFSLILQVSTLHGTTGIVQRLDFICLFSTIISLLQFKLDEGMDEEEAIHIDPAAYRRIGKRKVNTSTFIPRASKEMQGNADFCSLMDDTLEDVLIWQNIEVCLFIFYSSHLYLL